MNIKTSNLVHFINPEKIIRELDIEPDAVVADFGCGSGYFTICVASFLRRKGKVYALDALPEALESVLSKASLARLKNIVVRRVNLEKSKGSHLPSKSVDLVIIKDVLFQNRHKKMILREAYRVLKQDGQVLIVEWDNRDFSIGPDKKLRIEREKMETMIKKEHFQIEKIINAGSFHYAFVVVKVQKPSWESRKNTKAKNQRVK